MKYKVKIPIKKQLTQPDQFLSTFARITWFITRYRKPVLVATGVLILLIVVTVTVVFLKQRTEARAWSLEGEAASAVRGPFPDLERARRLSEQLIERYPRSAAARLAQYKLGTLSAELDDHSAATAALEAFLVRYPASAMTPLVSQRLGYLYLAAGRHEEARQMFDAVLQREQAPNRDQAQYELAQLLEARGRTEAAIVQYEHVIAQFPDSPIATEAVVKLERLMPREELGTSEP